MERKPSQISKASLQKSLRNKPSQSKTQVKKTGSEISMTPSQATELAKQNVRKNPLDVLSKSAPKLTIERRSGLQDVDEEYLKQNIFIKPRYIRNSGLNDDAIQSVHTLPPAGQPSTPYQHGDGLCVNQCKAYVETQQQQPKQPCAHQHHHHHQHPHQNQQQYHQTTVTPGQVQVQTPPAGGIHNGVTSQQQPQQQEQQFHHQTPPTQAADTTSISQAEPEMCTTCPNCQTTIYLVRGADLTPQQPSTQMPPSNNAATTQQQQMPHNDNNVAANVNATPPTMAN